MDPELNPGSPPQGAPAVGPTDEDLDKQVAAIYATHKKEQQQNPAEPEQKPAEPNRLTGFLDKLRNDPLNPSGKVIADTGTSVARGLAKTVQGVSNTADAIYDVSVGPVLDKLFGPSKSPHHELLTDAEIDGALGEKHAGVLGAVEDITQFSAGVAIAGQLGIPTGVSNTAKAAYSAVKVGLGAAIAVDPYEHRISSIIAQAPSFISDPVKALLVSNPETDGPIVARLKSGLENTLTAFAIDKLISGVVALRTGKPPVAVKYDPEVHGPVQVKPLGNGQHVLSIEESQKALESLGQSGYADTPTQRVKLPNSDAGKVPTVQAVKYAKAQIGNAEFRRRAEAEIARRGVKGNVDGEKAAIEQVARDTFHDTIGADRRNVTSEGIRLRAEFDKIKANDSPEAILADRRSALIEALKNPVYATEAEAEAVASSINNGVRNSKLPKGKLTTGQIKLLVQGDGPIAVEDLVLAQHPAFELSYTATPEESAQTVAEIAGKLPKRVQTHAETVQQAEGLLAGKSGAEVVQMMKAANIASEDMAGTVHAGDLFLKRQGATIVKLGRALDAMPDNPIAANELQKAVDHLVGVYTNGDSFISSIGRALNAKQIVTEGGLQGHEIMKAAGALADNFKGWGKADYQAFARQIANTEGGAEPILDLLNAQGLAATARTKPVGIARSIMDKVNTIRMNAMLWGPVTHTTTLASNIMTTLQRPTEMWWGGVNMNVAGLIKGEGWGAGSAMQQQGADMLSGVFWEFKDALKAGRQAFASGVNVLDKGNGIVNDAGENAARGPLNGIVQVAKLPERLLMTNDEIFKTLGYRSYVRAQSLRMSRSQGITDATEMATRLAADMKAAFTSKGGATDPAALRWARVATQQTPLEPGSMGRWYQKGVQDFPVLRLITPFVRTPINLFNYAWERTPVLNLLQKSVREDFAAGGERAALAMSKTQMGMALWGGAAMLAYDKTITGGGPLDPELRQQWLAAGHQPYSVRVPGAGWVSYQRGNPVFTAVGIVADIVEMSGEMSPEALQEHAAMFAASIASNITNQTFMQGLSETLDAFSDKSGRSMAKFFTSLETSFIPNVTRQINPDDTLRETRGAIDAMKARIPGLSNTLEPRRNILGEPVMKGPGIAQRFWNPFTVMSPVDDHSVQEQMVAMGKAMSMPSERLGKLNLTDRDAFYSGKGKRQSPYDRQLELLAHPKDGSPSLRQALTDLMKSDQWKQMGSGTEAYPGGERYKRASWMISQYQDRAMKQVKLEYPKLAQEIDGQKFDKKSALHAPPSSEQRPQFLSQ